MTSFDVSIWHLSSYLHESILLFMAVLALRANVLQGKGTANGELKGDIGEWLCFANFNIPLYVCGVSGALFIIRIHMYPPMTMAGALPVCSPLNHVR